jgi:hypothetical protein
MDQRRYDDLLGRNVELAARVKQLEQDKITRDTSYTPAGIDPDLMYADDYVDAAYNPQAVAPDDLEPETQYSGPGIGPNRSVRHVWRTLWRGLFAIVATFAVSFLVIWLVFIKRWGGQRPARASENASRDRNHPQPFRRRRH